MAERIILADALVLWTCPAEAATVVDPQPVNAPTGGLCEAEALLVEEE